MASSITSADLKVRIIETIELNGKDRGSDNTLTISSINEVDSRIMTALSSSEQSLFKLSNNVSAGTFITSSLKYARVTNKDDSNHIRLRISSSHTSDFRIEPGRSFIITNSQMTGSATGSTVTSEFTASGWNNVDGCVGLNNISAEPSGSDVDVEIFIAST